MSRDKPILRAIKLLSLIERHPNGLRVADMAEQLISGKNGKEDLSGFDAIIIPYSPYFADGLAEKLQILALNKVDLVRNKSLLLPLLQSYLGAVAFRTLVPGAHWHWPPRIHYRVSAPGSPWARTRCMRRTRGPPPRTFVRVAPR